MIPTNKSPNIYLTSPNLKMSQSSDSSKFPQTILDTDNNESAVLKNSDSPKLRPSIFDSVKNVISSTFKSIVDMASSSPVLPADNFIDQRNALAISDSPFKLSESNIQKKAEIITDANSCQICGENFEHEDQLVEHKQTDEHMFRRIYQNCK